jgi:hypothetical protein
MATKSAIHQVDAAELAKKAFNAPTLKNRAATAKRTATALRKLVTDTASELGEKERASLDGALSTLAAVASVYKHAHEIRMRSDAARDKRRSNATAIAKRLFGHFESVEDKIALVAAFAPERLRYSRLEELTGKHRTWEAKELLNQTEVFDTVAYYAVNQEADMEAHIASLVAKFQTDREGLQIKWASHIIAVKQSLED